VLEQLIECVGLRHPLAALDVADVLLRHPGALGQLRLLQACRSSRLLQNLTGD
jgi:hypothetical protein